LECDPQATRVGPSVRSSLLADGAVTGSRREASLLTMESRAVFPGESLLVRAFVYRYLRALRREGGAATCDSLAAEATARLSIEGIHQLRDSLRNERDRCREAGRDSLADALTSAVRSLDSRAQILDDLLH